MANRNAVKYGSVVAIVLIVAALLAWLAEPSPVPDPAPTAPAQPHAAADLDCVRPPAAILSKVGLDLTVTSAKYKELAIGSINVKTDPGVIDTVGTAVRDSEMQGYLRCLALNRDHFTASQAAYLEVFNGFVSTKPTPEAFIRWQSEHPFPSAVVDRTVHVCPLDVTAEWEGLNAGSKSAKCDYVADAGCTILSAEKEKESNNNGASRIDIGADHRSLTAYASANAHGSAVDRKRGWIAFSVAVTLRCPS